MALPGFLNDKIIGVKTIYWLILIGVLSIGGIYYAMTRPVHASWRYGACRALLEQYVRFPITVNVEQGGETRGSAFISFSDINPFGSQTVRNFECHFSQDAKGHTVLSKVTVDRKSIKDEQLRVFQKQLSVLVTQELDTALPRDLPSNLQDYKD